MSNDASVRPRERKPILKKRPSGKFKMAPFQREDIAYMSEMDSSANWSEMGSFKTTTTEWLWDQKLKHIPNPRVLVITTKTGKGTYFESLAEVLPEWDVYTINAKTTNLVIGQKPVPLNVQLPTPLHFRPVVVVAHYHCFTDRACLPEVIKGENGLPSVDPETGLFEMKIPHCAHLLGTHWDMIVIDEAHRIKNHDAQWSRNIKKMKAQYKHIMTGTGFVNNPSEIWSLLNFLFPQVYTSYWKFREYFCNTPDAPIWMSDLSFKALARIEIGDKVVGWESKPSKGRWDNTKERKLVESEVLAVSKRQAPVVKVTMKSGRTVKCTEDHLWLSGRGKGSIDRWTNVFGDRVGVNETPKLVHVIDPTPKLVEPQKQYAAAYLGAMMDGEGTWPVIAQSPSANPEVHARIRETLDELGFNWNHPAIKSKFRINGYNGSEYGAPEGIPNLELNRACRQTAVNFLNWCNPAKRTRIVNSVLGKGRWRLSDEIESVEMLGVQEVISMTTTTGNYIAWGYASKNCEEDDYSGYRKVVGIREDHEDEFKQLVRRVGVRRTMIECFPDIEEPIETVVPVELNKVQRKMYDELLEHLHTMDQMGEPLHSPNVLSMLNRLRQICVATPEVTGDHYDPKLERRVIEVKLTEPSSKLDATMEIIEGLEWDKERHDQVVVFSAFKDPLELLATRLDKAKVPYLRMRAEMNESQRYELWHDQWNKKEHQVFLSTLALGSESINLASANRAIFLDQSWSPATNKQAIGRIYRPGQTGVCQLIYIRAEDTVDYRVLAANEEKHGWFKAIFGKDEEEGDEDA